MAFNFKSLGNIVDVVSTANDLASTASGLIKTVKENKNKKESKKPEVKDATSAKKDGKFSQKIENLIALVLEDGEFSEEEREMLARVAEKEGFDPDEVIFTAKKRLKLSMKAGSQVEVAVPIPSLTRTEKLAAEISEIDKKFDAAIEAIYSGDSSAVSSILDTLTGGISGLAVSIGKSLFTKSDDDKVLELEEQRESQINRIVAAVTTPNEFTELVELIEYVNNQTKQRDEVAWNNLHLTLSKRGLMLAGDDEIKKAHINMFLHKSLLPKKKKKFGLL